MAEEAEQKKSKKELTKLEKWFRFLHRMIRFLRFAIPIKKYGHVTPYNDGAYIFVCNHRSFLDVFPVAVATDRPVHFIAKKNLENKRLGRWFVNKSECILVSRDGTDARALMQTIKYLKNGENVGIFPEGTRNKGTELFLPFKSGATTISIRTKTPIVPMVVYKKIKLFHKTRVIYGEPLEFSDYYDKKLTDEIVALCDEILVNEMTTLYGKIDTLLNKKKK